LHPRRADGNPILVGVAGSFAGSLVIGGLHLKAPSPPQPRYWRPNLALLLAGVATLALAWFTNLPRTLAGLVADQDFAARVATGS
jgi:hypothetical protein